MLSPRLSPLVLALLAPVTTAQCNRAALLALSQTYIQALQNGSSASLVPLGTSAGITYTFNNNASSLATPPNAILSAPLVIDHNRTTVDTSECATYTELISTTGPFVLGTQIRYTANTSRHQILSIDTVAATTGSWMFNATATLGHIEPEDWSALAEGEQPTRDRLELVADSYLNMWMNRFSQNQIPWGTPCARTEGGNRFEPDCKVGIPTSGNVYIGERRYVIDESVGSVQVLCQFGSLPDSHEFRLVGGRLVLVHAITG